MRVLLPLDIVHPIDATIEDIAVLMPLKEAEVMLLYVKEELPSYERLMEAVGDFDEDWGHQVESKAKAAFDHATNLLKPHCNNISTEIVTGPPAMLIETVARDEKFAVTVLTPGRRGRVELFLLGSVSGKVVKHGPGTVVISRPPDRPKDALRNIVMGIDGSANSRYAIEQALKQFAIHKSDTAIKLIHVVSVADVLKLVSPVEYISMVENNLLLEGETFLADGKTMLADHGFNNVECILKEGDPATEIINLANTTRADLIVIGAQGRTDVQHFLMGSVSHRIAMRAPCTIAVVKPRS